MEATQAPANGTGRSTADTRDTASRRDLKRQRRDAQLAAQRQAEAARQRRQRLIWGAAAAGVIIAIGLLAYWLMAPSPAIASKVQTFPIQGQTHIARGQSHPPYNSTPPTSGWHYADAVAPWGVTTIQIADEVQVHNLEHGGIMIQYYCPSACPETVSALQAIGRSYPSKVVVAPYKDFGHPIALTAWGKLAYLDKVDEEFIRTFISQNKNKAPEQVPD